MINMDSADELWNQKLEKILQEVDQERQIKQQKRENLLKSWGTNEEEVRARDLAKEIEKNVFGYEFESKKKKLTDAKKYLKDLMFNYEKLIDDAKQKIIEETNDFNNYMNEHQSYSRMEYDSSTGKYISVNYTAEDVNRLWAKAGGKEKWKNINLHKKGSMTI